MSDLVHRLRNCADRPDVCLEAADEIERLQQRINGREGRQSTHSEECWRWHLDCAIAQVERLSCIEKAARDYKTVSRETNFIAPQALHRYHCPATRLGKSGGPCDCGGDALQVRIDCAHNALCTALEEKP